MVKVYAMVRPASIIRASKTWSVKFNYENPFFRSKLQIASYSVEFTWKHYNVNRRQDLAKVASQHLKFFEQLLPGRVLTDENDLEGPNTDWLRMMRGMSPVLLKPQSTQEVSEILKYCNVNRIPVCPQGGNTGLVGGSVPVFDEVILSMQLMNQIYQIDPAAGYVVCQAGVVLQHLDSELEKHGLMVPIDLGAKGSCHLGGNVSTNAGGLRFLRYGSLHGSVLGLEAVLADGTILDCLSTLKKDNTGYDLKQLFIGSEGTLGVVTKVSLAVPTRPKSVNLSFLGVKAYGDIRTAFLRAKTMLGEILSAFEFLSHGCMMVVRDNLGLQNVISDHPFYVLVETSGSNSEHDLQKLESFLQAMMDEGVVLDGTVASEPSKMREIWQLRERIAEGLLKDGEGRYKYDISVPVEKMYDIIPELERRVGARATRVVGYGHFGDGNIHVNVVTKHCDDEVVSLLEPFIFEWTARHGGSISAEHGLGFKKANMMRYSRPPEAIALMKKMKQLFDPHGILNPYKTLPSS